MAGLSKLVIVESPAKAKTIQKYLGKGYKVVASNGHVRDLPKSKLGVDVEGDFTPHYVDIKDKAPLITQLKKTAKSSEFVYLATDPDREGEAISWHLANLLGVDMSMPNRVTFHEITKSGVKNGMEHPRQIDQKLVDAQQARRILDRLVGYKISPFLWRKIKRNLSAGRVQSVAVRMIVDREQEIRAFTPTEYWSIDATLTTGKKGERPFAAKLIKWNGQKLEQLSISSKEQAEEIVAALQNTVYVVDKVTKGVRKKTPAPPFITSTLQQEASRRLGYQSQRTMKIAQELYEGVEIEGVGTTGLITYMRTDSLRISDEAAAAAEELISSVYGKKFLPEARRVFKSKKNVQDAHEAIRPSDPRLTPQQVQSSLSNEQYKLYKLIWERFLASQMANAVLNTVSVETKAGAGVFKSNGFTVEFEGFTVLYEETKDEDKEAASVLPPLSQQQALQAKALQGNQHSTQPPPRYTEASLIKTLEENGIGRPSTYAPTISTVIKRGYVEREAKALKPTGLGEVTTGLMAEQFADIVDASFTANMESKLDDIEDGKLEYRGMIADFYKGFAETLARAEKNLDGTRLKVPVQETDVICEKCGRNMVIKEGKFGKFLACPGFPECSNTKKIVQETPGSCPVCGGKIHTKKSKSGRTFFGCSNYPNCSFVTWDKPLEEKCPVCSATLFQKTGRGAMIHCLHEGCQYARDVEKKS